MHDIRDMASRLLDDYLEGDDDNVWRDLHENKTPMQTNLLIAAIRDLMSDAKEFDAWLATHASLDAGSLGS